MKKLIVLFSMMFFIMGSAFAQKGIQSAGVHLSYGTEIESFGIGVKYQYMITDKCENGDEKPKYSGLIDGGTFVYKPECYFVHCRDPAKHKPKSKRQGKL